MHLTSQLMGPSDLDRGARASGAITAWLALAAFLVMPAAAQAMVYGDSRILSRAEMHERGVDLAVQASPGAGPGIVVSVSAVHTGGPPAFESMSYAVLTRELDPDLVIADTRKRGFVVTKKWGPEERSESSRKLTWTFALSASEVPRSYFLVRMNLPPKGGVPVFGTFYFLLRDLLPPSAPGAGAHTGSPRSPDSSRVHPRYRGKARINAGGLTLGHQRDHCLGRVTGR